ncbi:MAG: ATP-binding protein [Myxococcales bacterium]|nr:ATP-binding protein [Myxococcales bacterium]MCB9531013.1 ATP-binding protein [Myxococcales bacterium]
MADTLSDERLRELYSAYPAAEDWCDSMLRAIEAFHAQSPEQQRTRAAQEGLWRIRGVASVGIGSGVPVTEVFDDEAVVERILGLPALAAATRADALPERLQAEFDDLVEMVVQRTGRNRPVALLGRVFVVMLPDHLNTVFNYKANRNLGRLLVPDPPAGLIAVRVAVRRRLRTVLGAEADLAESVRRIAFCWWLADQPAEELRAGGARPVAASPIAATVNDDQLAELQLWGFTKQLKGWPSVSGYVETYRSAVRATYGGASREEVAEALAELPELDGTGARSLRNIVDRVRRLGFLENRGGILWPTEDGEELVEVDPPVGLTERLLVRVYGMAQMLRLVSAGPVHPNEAFDQLCEQYPAWTTSMAPSSLASWSMHLGLIERDETRKLVLSDYGRLWHARLPALLPTAPPDYFDVLQADDDGPAVDPVDPGSDADVSVKAVRDAIRADPKLADFVLDDAQLGALHAAWHGNPRKRFVIFSGLSGTGKTALLRHYAHAYCGLAKLNPADHIAMVAVSPDWRDPTGLLGYFNALHADPTYQAEATTRLLVRAAQNPDLPYFLILDEMNLARVERYLAPLLSAMETGEPIHLHAHEQPVNGVPPRVRWPARLFIGGTVNMDESTHGFSDKVLDRAFTLEFWEVALGDYFDRRAKAGTNRHHAAESLLIELHDLLRPIRRHSGYRAANEVLLFVERAAQDGMIGETAALDQAVFSKILPRLRGTDLDGLEGTLGALAKLLGARSLARSESKVRGMLEALTRTGVTKFFA